MDKRIGVPRRYRGTHQNLELNACAYNARSKINKKTELNIMVDDIKPHIIGITESWANNDITDAELGLEGYVMFRKDRMGRRGGGVLLYRLLTALSILPRSAFDGFYLQMSLSHGYLFRIRINQVREVSIVYCQWIVIAYGIPFH